MKDSRADSVDMANRFTSVRAHFGALERRELSQREMADRVDVTKNTWQRYEAGDLPSASVLLRLVSKGINSHWLLTGEGQMLRNAHSQAVPEPPAEVVKCLDAIEAELDKANVPVSVERLGKGSALLDMYRQLVAISGDPGVDGNLRARADMMLDLGFVDAGSATRRERRMERGMEEMRHSLKSATDAYTSLLLDLQWEPPGLVGMAVRDAMMVDGLSDEMARFILAAVKEEMTKSEKRGREG